MSKQKILDLLLRIEALPKQIRDILMEDLAETINSRIVFWEELLRKKGIMSIK